jgi:hypothetical protein
MPVVQLPAAHDNRRQRRARMGRSHPFITTPETRAEPRACGVSAHCCAVPLPPDQAMLLELFGRPPVVFHRSFVEIAGGVNGALWLSHAMAIGHEPGTEGAATFLMSAEQCTEATGMSSREQDLARKQLRSAGLLFECRRGDMPVYRLDLQRLAGLLQQCGGGRHVPRGVSDAPLTKALHATAA